MAKQKKTESKKEEKQELETLKKTAEAHKTLSEKEAEEKAKEAEKITEDLLGEEDDREVKNLKAKAEREAVEKELAEKAEAEAEKEARKKELVERGKESLLGWEPRTKLGREVKDGKITDINEILGNNRKILEEQIVDSLLDLKTDLILIGQAKGKFGGGKRRAWRQTQKKTKAKNIPTFSAMSVTGDENGHVGIGVGRAKETLPARDKAIRKSKIDIVKIKRACSSFDCTCGEPHTVPFKVTGKEGSVKVTLIPAPQGTGLVVGSELKKILKLAGIKDVYSRSSGKRQTTFNLVKACFNALKKTK